MLAKIQPCCLWHFGLSHSSEATPFLPCSSLLPCGGLLTSVTEHASLSQKTWLSFSLPYTFVQQLLRPVACFPSCFLPNTDKNVLELPTESIYINKMKNPKRKSIISLVAYDIQCGTLQCFWQKCFIYVHFLYVQFLSIFRGREWFLGRFICVVLVPWILLQWTEGPLFKDGVSIIARSSLKTKRNPK